MKKVINNTLYNTETAKRLGSYQHLYPGDLYYFSEELYRTKSGKYFIYGEGGPTSKYSEMTGNNSWSGGEKIIPISEGKAKEWAEQYLDGDEYIAAFGDPEDDIPDWVSVSVPGLTKVKIDALREETKLTLGEIVTRAIDLYIESKK